MDSLSPESRALYEILMADTEEIYESKFATYKKNKLDAVKQFVADTRMQVKDLQTTVDSVPSKVEIEVDPVKAALGEDLAAVKSALSSEISALAPATVVLASTPTLSTASMRAPSIPAVAPLDSASASTTSLHSLSSTKDGFTPGAQHIYDFLVGSSPAPTSTVPPRDASSVDRIAGMSKRAAATPSVTTAITKDELTQGARDISDLLVGGSSAPASAVSKVSSVPQAPSKLNVVPIVVQNKVTAIAATVPTTCSSECPCDDAEASVSVDISSATPNSPTTTCELAALVVDDKALAVDVTGGTAPSTAICLPGDPNRSHDSRTDPVALPLTLWTAPQSFNAPIQESPTIVASVFMSAAEDGLLKGGNSLTSPLPTDVAMMDHFATNKVMATSLLSAGRFTDIKLVGVLPLHKEIKRPPWPPPWSICIQFLPMTTILPLLVESVEYMREGIEMRLCCFSSQVAEFTVILCSVAGSISNMTKHISGDRPLLTTVDIELNATLTVIVFALGVLSVQLQPTVFRWSYPSSYIHFLSTSTLDFLLVRRAVQITRNLCCLDNLLGSFGSYNWAFEEEKGQVLLSMPWLSFRCQRVASNLILLGKLPTGHSHEDPNNCAGNCLETKHLQQWRPPEHVTSFASMDILFLRFKGCLSDIHWAQSTIAFLEDLHRHKQQTTRYLEVHNNHFPTELFVTENWLIPWEPGNDSLGQNLMENFTSLLITCELLYSISVDDNFLADHYLLRCMRCVQADGVGAPLQANETLLFPWDPGDYSSSAWRQGKLGGVVDACPFPRTDASQLPWDPGYSSQVRLGGKPNFKKGGLSATYLHQRVLGPPPWAISCLEARCRGDTEYIYLQSSFGRG